MRVVVIANIHAVMEVVVGVDVEGVEAEMRPVASVVFIVLEVVGVAAPAASFIAKVQGCRAALVEWVVVLALRGGSLFSEDADLSLLVAFGTSVGR